MDTTPKSQINNITPNWGNEEVIYYENKWQVKINNTELKANNAQLRN